MLNIGIIGAGRIGKVHLESISYHVKNAVVTAIADPFMNDETKAFCEGFGVEKIYTDYKKIIEDEKTFNHIGGNHHSCNIKCRRGNVAAFAYQPEDRRYAGKRLQAGCQGYL